jgi:hypothetical protein
MREPPPMPGGTGGPGGLRGIVQDILSLERGALVILVIVPIALTLLDYYGMPWDYFQKQDSKGEWHREIGGNPRRPMHAWHQMRSSEPPLANAVARIEVPGPPEVRVYVWWGLCCLAFLVLLPMLTAWFGARLSPRATGVRIRGIGRDGITYLILFLLFVPVVYLVSRDKAFQDTYPFFRPARWAQGDRTLGWDFVLFEIVYCSQFFAVEYFFRGFMVIGLKRYLGWASVLVMLAPYCMIHYYKPMPEAMGAIGAGLVLGTLSWRTETIMWGWALHYGVALTMDMLGLYHRGILGGS